MIVDNTYTPTRTEKKKGKGKKLEKQVEEVKGIAIDPTNAEILDDAILINKTKDGYEIYVSIVDISSIESSGEEIYTLAKDRFNKNKSPLIPEKIAKKISLEENKTQPAITLIIKADNDLTKIDHVIKKTLLTVTKKISYKEFDQILNNENHDLHKEFKVYEELAKKLLLLRIQNRALNCYDISPDFIIDETGKITERDDIQDGYFSEKIVREIMILTNKILAEFLAKYDVPILYRNHRAKKIITPDRSSLVDNIISVILNSKGTDVVIKKKLDIILGEAQYDTKADGHYGLNFPVYAYFTSPIRKLSALINQRILLSFIDRKKSPYAVYELDAIATKLNNPEQDGQRIDFENWNILKFFNMFFNADEFNYSNDSKHQAIFFLNQADDALLGFHITNMAYQKLNWSRPTYEVKKARDRLSLQVKATLKTDKDSYTSEYFYGNKTSELKNLALINIIAQVINKPKKKNHKNKVTETKKAPLNNMEQLINFCQKNSLPELKLVTEKKAVFFLTKVSITIGEIEYISKKYNKLELYSKENAAKELLEKLKSIAKD